MHTHTPPMQQKQNVRDKHCSFFLAFLISLSNHLTPPVKTACDALLTTSEAKEAGSVTTAIAYIGIMGGGGIAIPIALMQGGRCWHSVKVRKQETGMGDVQKRFHSTYRCTSAAKQVTQSAWPFFYIFLTPAEGLWSSPQFAPGVPDAPTFALLKGGSLAASSS